MAKDQDKTKPAVGAGAVAGQPDTNRASSDTGDAVHDAAAKLPLLNVAEGRQAREMAEPPIVAPVGADAQNAPFSEFSQWLEDTLGSESYGAPRVFDLYTLLAVTLAFALMFAFLRLIEPLLFNSLPQVAISLGTFVTLIAVAQLALWGGNKPRLASIVVGPIIWFVIGIGLTSQNPRMFLSLPAMLGLLCSTVIGLAAGYLGGAMVAGVFLLADTFRKHLVRQAKDEGPANDDFIFHEE